VLSGSALVLAIAAVACALLMPARLASSAVSRRAKRVIDAVDEQFEANQLALAQLRAQVVDVLDQTERKRASVSASASRLAAGRQSDEPLSHDDMLDQIRTRVAQNKAVRADAGWNTSE